MLKNLKTLRLYFCPYLESISVVGELLKLEILSCDFCEKIEALPIEIRRLKHLRLLEILYCTNLKTIVRGVISNLISLKELRIRDSFDGWEAKESTNTNAALVELEPLTKLTCLEIEIKDVSLVAEEICLPSQSVKYHIETTEALGTYQDYERQMCLEISGPMNVGNWIKTLVRSTELLQLKGDGANQLVNLVEPEKLKDLFLESCSSVKTLVNTTSVFPSLESLRLSSLHNLEEIIPTGMNGHNVRMAFPNLKCLHLHDLPRLVIVQETLNKIVVPGNLIELYLMGFKDVTTSSIGCLFSSFSNLEDITIGGFNGIKSIISPSIARNLVRLRSLTIQFCTMMLEVIADDEEEEEKVQVTGQISLFPDLEFLNLWFLPELRCFYQWNPHNTTLEFPSLSVVCINDCPQMETFTQGSVSTPNLKRISINNTSFDQTKVVNEAIQLYRRRDPIIAQEGGQDEITSGSDDP